MIVVVSFYSIEEIRKGDWREVVGDERMKDDEDDRVEGREVWLDPALLFYRLMLTGRQTLGGGLCSGMSFEVLAVKVDSVLKSEGFGLC